MLFTVWWVLTLGDVDGLVFGAVVTALASVYSMRLFPPSSYRVRPLGLLAFVGYFTSRSVVAGLDVARRLLSPALPVEPGEIPVTLSLPPGSPRWLLANTLSLMPGTLSVLLEEDQLILHCLDTSAPVIEDVRATERQVARMFGISLPHGDGAGR
jgi:multicomponent Na+:H+ antiporter subunit E